MTSRSWTGGSEAIAAALTFAIAVTLFTFGGRWLDGRFGTPPLFLIVGAAVGVLGGFLHVLARLAPDLLPFGRREGGGARRPRGGQPSAGRSTDRDPDDQPGS